MIRRSGPLICRPEHNLDLEFNSLDAQREACEAYIKSQAHEGWRLIPDRYDDGGLSGASLDRPALQNLLADVRAGKITVVVVYKVDRLTRWIREYNEQSRAGDPDLGGKAWPDKTNGDSTHPKMPFTQESERDQDLQAAIVGGGKRYAISLAVECFLDFREAFMKTALGLSGTSVDHCPVK